MLGALIACEASAGDPWDRFLLNPGIESSKGLLRVVDGSQCGWGNPANEEVAPGRVHGPLFNLIATGNEGAFRVGLSVVRCFDGGHLEDFYQSGGRFMEQQPGRFLAAVTEENVAESDIASLASSVVVVDDLDAELRQIVERIELLRDLNDEKIARARAESLRALQVRETDLRRMKASLE